MRCVILDGLSQTFSPPRGRPEVEISGILLGEGDGVVIDAPCETDVRGLAINGFPGAGLAMRGNRRCRDIAFGNRVTDNVLGADPTASDAIPNERGLVIESGVRWAIRNNVVGGNRRSGMFLWIGAESRITGNRVGLGRRDDLPLGNGGTGIFIGRGALGTDLFDNYIAFNRESGIAVVAPYVRIGLNSIHANGLLGIDVGLDGRGGSIVEPPRIESATYDPETQLTTIEGTATSAGSFGPDEVLLFANDACDGSSRGEGQYTLGRTRRFIQSNRWRSHREVRQRDDDRRVHGLLSERR